MFMNEPIPTHDHEPELKHHSKEKTTEPEKIVIENSPLKISINEGKMNWGTVTEWILLFITIVLAIYTIKTATYASDQAKAAIDAVRLGRNQFDYQRKQDSINAIRQDEKDLAQKTKDILFATSQKQRDSLSRESFQLENRAYIIFKTVSLDTTDFQDRGNKMSVKIINTGNTPARYTTDFAGITLKEDSIKSLFQKGKEILQSSTPKGFFIAANDSATLVTPLINPKINKPITFTRSDTIYFCGIIKYFDIFRIPRWTYFCIEWKYGTRMITYKEFNEVY